MQSGSNSLPAKPVLFLQTKALTLYGLGFQFRFCCCLGCVLFLFFFPHVYIYIFKDLKPLTPRSQFCILHFIGGFTGSSSFVNNV